MEMDCTLFITMVTAFVLLTVSTEYVYLLDDKECKESKQTAVHVDTCPKSAEDWKEAASRKGCQNIKFSENCTSFEYHCVINAWINETVEVCAPIRNIIGNVCAEFSFGGSRIQSNYNATCQSCPEVYLSNKSYNYSECYDLVYTARNRSRYLAITTPSTVETTIKTESIKPTASLNQKLKSNHQERSWELDTKLIIPISFGIVAVIVFILICLAHCSTKEHFFIRDFMLQRCSFRAKQKRSNPKESTNKDIENTPLKEEPTEHCLIYVEASSKDQ
ncbi:uncharacterized protein LOC133200642 [Saccostrea echinata]|uniref:uncharacterized protein LOC133200642 n=1 Tax=Saccostrea echinata TaxID=191078 RepID=UPI002A819DE5|nr:uncharacterized protein LOC133200642 [Saccostrea echinata]